MLRFVLTLILVAAVVADDVVKPTSLEEVAGCGPEGCDDIFWTSMEFIAVAIFGISTLYLHSCAKRRNLLRKAAVPVPRQGDKFQRSACGSNRQAYGWAAKGTRCENEANDPTKTYTRYTRKINDCVKYPDASVRALAVLREMNDQGFPPNLLNFGAAIGVCAKKGGGSDAALAVMRAIRKRGLEPDVVCYNAAITACAKSHKLKEAFDLLREMREQDLPPNEVTCNAAIDACAKAGEYMMARQLLQEMRTLGLEPSEKSYGPAIHACAKGNCWVAALELLDEMQRYGVPPNLHSFSSAINACAMSGRVQESLKLLQTMRSLGLQPNQICYSTVIKGCHKSKDFKTALDIIDQMKQEGLNPDDITYHVLMNLFRAAGRSEQVAALQAEMHGMSSAAPSLGPKCCRAGRPSRFDGVTTASPCNRTTRGPLSSQ